MQKYLHLILALLVSALCVIKSATAQNGTPYWSTLGNSNATSSSKLGTTNAINLRLLTRNIERVRVDTFGRVGVGTTTPAALFHVRSLATNAPVARFEGGATAMYLALYEAGQYRGYLGSYSGNNEDVDFGTGGSNSTGRVHLTIRSVPKLTVTTVGNVGIGTLAPTHKLHVAGNARFTSNLLVDNGGVQATNTTGDGVVGNTGSSEGAGVKGSGNFVGVYGAAGTHGVYGSGSSFGAYGTATGASSIGVYGWGKQGVLGGSGAFQGDGVYGSATGSGGVGVNGYSATSYGVYARTGNSGSYAGFFIGSLYSTGMYVGSDQSLKQDFAEISSALTLINRLQPKSYGFRQEGAYKLMNLPQGRHYGLIAQDVEQVLPQLVKETSFETAKALPSVAGAASDQITAVVSETIRFKAVNYTELIPLMIKGMQEQDVENKALRDEVAELRRMVLELKGSTGAISATSAYLEQNTPNPVRGTTSIRYHIPETARSAVVNITNVKGQVVKTISLNNRGTGQISLNTQALAAGTYHYTLYVDGHIAGTKRLVIAR